MTGFELPFVLSELGLRLPTKILQQRRAPHHEEILHKPRLSVATAYHLLLYTVYYSMYINNTSFIMLFNISKVKLKDEAES